MVISLFPSLVFLILFIIALNDHLVYSSISLISNPQKNHPCRQEESLALIKFKQEFLDPGFASPNPSETEKHWNRSTDCCIWDGVTCDQSTGYVTGLDLSSSHLRGTLHSNITLFTLSHLQRLDLSYNGFHQTEIPREFSRLASSLTHLNLSHSGFSGRIPSEMSHLSKLVSLDLSDKDHFATLGPHSFELLLQNLTHLRELYLAKVDISSMLPANLSSSLIVLDLQDTGLHGEVQGDIFSLPNLERLDLSLNSNLTGPLPDVNITGSSPLKSLDLSRTSFSGKLPEWIGQLKSLSHLDVHRCLFSGSIPRSLGNLTQLVELDLGDNNLSGEITDDTLSNLQNLELLNLARNNFNGLLPSSVTNLTQLVDFDIYSNSLTGFSLSNNKTGLQNLTYLYLRNNSLAGTIPSWLFSLPSLVVADLSHNLLYGSVPSSNVITGLLNLINLDLSFNSLSGTLPSWLLTLPKLENLFLRSNRFSQIDELVQDATNNTSSLEKLDLSMNAIQIPFPRSVSQLVNLKVLDLSSNALASGFVWIEILLSSLKLHNLDLSYTSLSVSTTTSSYINNNLLELHLSSCNITEFPEFLKMVPNLIVLDLSDNKIHGQIPDWATAMWGDMFHLNLSRNFLTGLDQFPWTNLEYLNLGSNLIHGIMPPSICSMSRLRFLDLSRNSFDGVIQQCLGNLSNQLVVMNLQMNGFHGTLPTTFATDCSLTHLNVNGNLLDGRVPRTLANCEGLEVLNLGNNHMNDSFPDWLEMLPGLQVLVLRSNRLHGPILSNNSFKMGQPFPQLRVLDLSHNEFSGLLPAHYFKNFKEMMKKDPSMPFLEYMDYSPLFSDMFAPGQDVINEYVSVTLVRKGVESEMQRIQVAFTSIDLSSNIFEGEIPYVIGELSSLLQLNLSHNNLSGHIPSSAGNLSFLESLDLSCNQLDGHIPQQLTQLNWLAALNLSENHLVGRIPQGSQFQTFQNDSFMGNPALCGTPLSKNCRVDGTETSRPPPLLQQDDSRGGFTWKVVVLGYGCGTAFGLVMGYLMFRTGKPKWFNDIVKVEEERLMKRQRKRIHISIRT